MALPEIKIVSDSEYFNMQRNHCRRNPHALIEDDDSALRAYWTLYRTGFDEIGCRMSKHCVNEPEGISGDFTSTTQIVNDGRLLVVVEIEEPQNVTIDIMVDLFDFTATSKEGFAVELIIDDFNNITFYKNLIAATLVDNCAPELKSLVNIWNQNTKG